jgi:DNA-binding response OmpR family regulator
MSITPEAVMKHRNGAGDTQHLLVIEDDTRLADALVAYMEKAGFRVAHASDGEQGLKLFYRQRPDLVLLDVMMPSVDGWEVCRRLRQISHVPIIMLTARGQEQDRVLGLKMGADDYVSKPFSLRELEARVLAVLRRSQVQPREEVTPDSGILFNDGYLIVDGYGWEVTRDGKRIELTSTERKLFFYLVENKGRILSPDQILEHVWGSAYADQPDYVKLYVWRVRQKIEPGPAGNQYIVTERGLGYKFARSADDRSAYRGPRPA